MELEGEGSWLLIHRPPSNLIDGGPADFPQLFGVGMAFEDRGGLINTAGCVASFFVFKASTPTLQAQVLGDPYGAHAALPEWADEPHIRGHHRARRELHSE